MHQSGVGGGSDGRGVEAEILIEVHREVEEFELMEGEYVTVECDRCQRKLTHGEQGYHYCKTVGFCMWCAK